MRRKSKRSTSHNSIFYSVFSILGLLVVVFLLWGYSSIKQYVVYQDIFGIQLKQKQDFYDSLPSLSSKSIIFRNEGSAYKYYAYTLTNNHKKLLFTTSYNGHPNYIAFSPTLNSVIEFKNTYEKFVDNEIRELVLSDVSRNKEKTIFQIDDKENWIVSPAYSRYLENSYINVFSNDGQNIAFTVLTRHPTYQATFDYHIYVMNLRDQKSKVIFEKKGIVESATLVPIYWTRDNKKIYLTRLGGIGLWIIDSDGSNIEHLSESFMTSSNYYHFDSISPDDKYITYREYRKQEDNIQLYDINFQKTTEVVSASRNGHFFYKVYRWSPDGKEFIYQQYLPSGNLDSSRGQLFIYNVETKKSIAIDSWETILSSWNKQVYSVPWFISFDTEKQTFQIVANGKTIDRTNVLKQFPDRGSLSLEIPSYDFPVN